MLGVKQHVSTRFQNILRAVGSKVVKGMGWKVKAWDSVQYSRMHITEQLCSYMDCFGVGGLG